MQLKINTDILLKILIIFVYFPPIMIERMHSNIGIFFDIATLLVTAIAAFDFITSKIKLERYEISLLVFLLYSLIIVLLFSPDDVYSFLAVYAYPIVSGYFIFSYMARHDYRNSILAIGVYFSVIVILNMVTMIVFPQGVFSSNIGAVVMRANWLIGSKNNVTQYVAPILLFLFLSSKYSERNVGWKLIILLFVIEVVSMGSEGVEFLAGSTSAIFIILVMTSLHIFCHISVIKKVLRFLTAQKQFVIVAVITGIIIYISLSKNQNNILGDFLAIFGKDISFSFRDIVWIQVVKNIIHHPIVGSGMNSDIQTVYTFIGSIVLRFGCMGFLIIFNILKSTDNDSDSGDDSLYRIGLLGLLVGGLVNEIFIRVFIMILTFRKCNSSRYYKMTDVYCP